MDNEHSVRQYSLTFHRGRISCTGGLLEIDCVVRALGLTRRGLEHRYLRHVDLALVFVYVSAQVHMMSDVVLQNLRIHYIPGFPSLVCDEGDFVAVRFHRTRDVQQRRFSIILLRFLGPPGFSRRRT